MVKADPKRNYYADLEIPLNATHDDIKKQFRKLARLYHPDRNQGKELEFVPKFQAIQAAHEILGDPNERAKYDADRNRLGYLNKPIRPPFPTAHTASGRTAPHRHPHPTQKDSPLHKPNAASPHPPKPPPRPQTHFHPPPPPNATKPSWYGAAGASQPQSTHTASHGKPSPAASGASRFSHFHPPPSARAGAGKEDPNIRASAFSAWQSMQNRGTRSTAGTGQNTPAASTPGSEDERRFSEGPFGRASAANPGLRRSHTTRTPKKAGFDPNQLGDSWEPPATRTSSYTTRHSFAAQGGQEPADHADDNHSKAGDDSTTPSQPKNRHSHHDLRPFTSAPDQPVFGERLSTPYRTPGGEKIHLNSDTRRSASVRDVTKLGARFEMPNSSPSSRGAIPRSQSVSARGTGSARRRSHQAEVIDLTDSSDSTPPRPMAKPSRKWQSPTKGAKDQPQTHFRPHNSDPERPPFINTEFSSSEDFHGFKGSDGYAPPPKSTSRSRSRMSPTRRAQNTTDPSQFPDPFTFKSMFPQHPTMKAVPQNKDATRSPVKFDQDQWVKSFKEPSLFMPDPVSLGSQTVRPNSTTSRRQNRPRTMSKSDEQLGPNAKVFGHGTIKEPTAGPQPDRSAEEDDDAMDLDLDLETGPSVRQTRSTEGRPPRNVTMPPHRKSWHTNEDPTQAHSNPSTVHVSPPPFPAVPTAVPNAMPPPPPPPRTPPLYSPLPPKSREKISPNSQVNGISSSFSNLADLGQNLTSRGPPEAVDLTDLSTTLPFESRPSDRNPKAPPTGPVNIPKPPTAPPAPMSKKLTQQQWKQYVSEVSVYMGSWYQWDSRILEHLQTRHHESTKFGTGLPSVQATALLEARGDVQAGGIERWEAELEQDRRVREFWGAASNKHQKCVREFVAVKRRVAVDGLMP